MKDLSHIELIWPDGKTTIESLGSDWLNAALNANIEIPVGCLKGSCGACEIDVNGRTIRACISKIDIQDGSKINIDFTSDPYW